MRTTIDVPDSLLRRAKTVAAKRKTTFRALVLDALERRLEESPGNFVLEDASAGSVGNAADVVSASAINDWIDASREGSFRP
jgi:hypothetical protein